MIRRAFILPAMICMAGVLSAAGETVLEITDFGATPDSGQDATPAVTAAIRKAAEIAGPVIIRFPKGRYEFFKSSAVRVRYPVTGVHQQWDHVTPIHLDGLSDLTIDGQGSLFKNRGRMTPVIVHRRERVRLLNLVIDQEFPSVQEAVVSRVTPQSVDFKVHPDTRCLLFRFLHALREAKHISPARLAGLLGWQHRGWRILRQAVSGAARPASSNHSYVTARIAGFWDRFGFSRNRG